MVVMNAHRFANTGDYLRDFLRALHRQSALKGRDTYNVEICDEGLRASDVALLR